MGADLVFNWVAIGKGKEQETKKKLLKEAEKFDIPELSENTKVKIINSLTEEKSNEFKDFCEFWEEGLNGNFKDSEFPIDEKGKIITNKGVKENLKKVIEEFFESLNYRDVSYIEHKGDMIYLTGGMSWGDYPTDSCDTFNKFIYLPQKILTAGGIKN